MDVRDCSSAVVLLRCASLSPRTLLSLQKTPLGYLIHTSANNTPAIAFLVALRVSTDLREGKLSRGYCLVACKEHKLTTALTIQLNDLY